jgi:protein mago nashi
MVGISLLWGRFVAVEYTTDEVLVLPSSTFLYSESVPDTVQPFFRYQGSRHRIFGRCAFGKSVCLFAGAPTLSRHQGMTDRDDFYVRYYVGHRGQFGHEFMEFELHPSGKLRCANNSNYKSDSMIRKEVFVSPAVVEEVKRIIVESNIIHVDDCKWKEPEDGTIAGRQELECKVGSHHIAFTTCEIGSLTEIQKSADPEGLTVFYKLIQDLKELILTLISCHFKARPI